MMKIFIRILRVIFVVSILIPYAYVSFVYSNYWNAIQSGIIFLTSAVFLILATVLLSFFDDSVNRKYIYSIIAFSAMGGFIFAGPYLSQFADYLFIQKNENNLNQVISEMKTHKLSRIYIKNTKDSTDRIKKILLDLQIADAQLTEDGSILFMEGGFMQADGWCYSESGVNPKKYFLNINDSEGKEKYEEISFWKHSFGNWYRWTAR